MQAWQDFLLCKPIDSLQDEKKRQGNQAQHDRYCILPLLVDAISRLRRLRLTFQGHEEGIRQGCILEVLDLVARWNAAQPRKSSEQVP